MQSPREDLSIDFPEPEIETDDTYLYCGDALSVLDDLPEGCVDAVVTDPPYNYEDGFLQQEWDNIGSGEDYREWCRVWALKCLRVLGDTGYLIAFSSNRQHHQLFAGIEAAGFRIINTACWLYGGGLPKSPRLKTWLDNPEEIEKWGDWRGMLKPAVEYAVIAIPEETQGETTLNAYSVKNSKKTYLLPEPFARNDSFNRTDIPEEMSKTPVYDTARFFYEPKASVSEKTHNGRVENDHSTVKPVELMKTFIELTTERGDVVMDPFAGTGTTSVAALDCGRRSIGIEQDKEYFETASQRVEDTKTNTETKTATLDMFSDTETDTVNQSFSYEVDQEIASWDTVKYDVPPIPDLQNIKENSIHAVIGTALPAEHTIETNSWTGDKYRKWCEQWTESAFSALKPGGHVVAFGGSRTHHHLAFSLENVGFEIRDAIVWVYSVGNTNSCQLCCEIAVMARKPVDGSAVQNQITHGVGNLDIESCRVRTDVGVDVEVTADDMNVDVGLGGEDGRYPANVLFSETASHVLDAQSGISTSTGGRAYQNTNDMYSGGWAEERGQSTDPGYGDEGGASRYYNTFTANPEPLNPSIGGEQLMTKPDSVYHWLEQLVTVEGQTVIRL